MNWVLGASETHLQVSPYLGDSPHCPSNRHTPECGTFLEYIDPPPIAAAWKCPVCEQHLEDPVMLQCGLSAADACLPTISARPPAAGSTLMLDGATDQETAGALGDNDDDAGADEGLAVVAVEGALNDQPEPAAVPCEAVVTVGTLEAHLAGECPAQRARCPQCGRAVARAERAAHLAERCPGRRVACPKCTQLVAARELMQSETGARHLRQECPRRLRACRKGCGQRVPLADMEEHCRRDCPNKPQACPYAGVGCEELVAPPERAAHGQAHLGAHVDLLLGALTRAQAEAAQTRHELALTKDQLAQTRQQAARTEQLLEQTRQQARDAERLLDQTGQQTFQNERLLDQTRQELGKAKAQAAQHGRQLTETRHELAQTKEALEQTRQQAARTEQALDQTRQELAQSRQAMAGLTGRLEALAATVAPLEEARRKAAEEQEARRKAEEARRKAAEEEARRKAAAEEEARRKAAEEARRKAAEEEARRKAAEEEARRKAAAEEEALRKAAAEAEAEAQLNLHGRGLTDRCAVALAGWLATNRTVTQNRIGDEGARALAAALPQNSTLREPPGSCLMPMHPSPRSSSSSSIVLFGTAFVSMGEGRVLGAGRYGHQLLIDFPINQPPGSCLIPMHPSPRSSSSSSIVLFGTPFLLIHFPINQPPGSCLIPMHPSPRSSSSSSIVLFGTPFRPHGGPVLTCVPPRSAAR
ncbi:hypothetical protein PAPYR_12312 [Paratrimastix pyriformis]|uniref:TRAF-type domain-containing protein n=1 Tax=Paratrimastix pyriformis TaxID=342808 RepID=A0ABQ8U6N4_9EUKA|nr:hypothetical protein PAPYR_12312 [Paratrimastix pyriformis]